MKQLIFYLMLCLLTFSCRTENKTVAELLEPSKAKQINEVGTRYLQLGRFNGSILVSKEEAIVYQQSFGLANYEDEIPFTDKTAFKIGEISELITAGLVRDFVAAGKFSLADSVSTYLPSIDAKLTINDLLHQNTEIEMMKVGGSEVESSAVDYSSKSKEAKAELLGTDFTYNLLGRIIENVSGKSYQENIADYSERLGLKNTYFVKEDSNAAVGYLYKNVNGNGLELQRSPVYDPSVAFSSSGLKSTILDLNKIMYAQQQKDLSVDGYLEDDGFSYSLVYKQDLQLSIIVLSNRRHPVAKELSTSISAILDNKEYQLPLARTPYKINTDLLSQYAGFYQLNDNIQVEVLIENDSLFVMMGPNKMHLTAQSDDQFYMEQRDAAMRFLKDSTGQVQEVELLDGFLKGNKIRKINI